MLSKSQISFIRSLQQKKQRNEHKLFIAEGVKVVEELLQSNFTIQAVYYTGVLPENIQQLAAKVLKNDQISEVSSTDMERISAFNTASAVLLLVEIPQENDLAYFYTNFDELVLVIDEVKDPGNLGTIIRLADWFGIKNLVCSPNTVDLYNPKTIQATMGSIGRVNVVYTELETLLSKKQANVPVYGALLEGDNVYKQELHPKGYLLMGSESHGISPVLWGYITKAIHIPAVGKAESLNVALATAIICSEFMRTNLALK